MRNIEYKSINKWGDSGMSNTLIRWTEEGKVRWKLRGKFWTAHTPPNITGWFCNHKWYLTGDVLYLTLDDWTELNLRHYVELNQCKDKGRLLSAILFHGQHET